MKCSLCGSEIHEVKWAIRDYVNESYLQWVWRHVKTVLLLRSHREDGSLPICSECYDSIRFKQFTKFMVEEY